MMDARIMARRIVAICERSRINVSTEGSAHLSLSEALRAQGVEVQDEVPLNAKDRIDMLIGAVGVEVKIKGQRRDIYRQLQRYAASDRIEALVLVTSAPWPASIREIGGKPFFNASLSVGWL